MPRKLLEQLLLVTASVLLMFGIWASPIANLEVGLGLRALYAVRGMRSPPADVVIVALDLTSAHAMGLQNRPNLWPRNLHAQLIDGLKARGATVIGIDLLFDRGRDNADDTRLVESMRAAANVVLVASVTREAITSKQGAILASVDRLVRPLPDFEKAAMAVAPFVLPKTPDGVFQFWSFLPSAGDHPSMPLVLSLPMMSKEYAELVKVWRSVSGRSAVVDSNEALTPESALGTTPDLLRALRGTLTDEALTQASSQSIQLSNRAQTLGRLLSAPELHALNLYGPIGTIKTIRYRDALNLVADSNLGDKAFKGKAVLIGYSEFNQPEQRDAYATPFTTVDGLDISGVELCGTALANLLDGSTLRKPSPAQTWLLLLAWSVILALPWLMKRTLFAVLITTGFVFSYALLAIYSFSQHAVWLPVVIPLILHPTAVAGLGLGLHVWRGYRKQRDLRHRNI